MIPQPYPLYARIWIKGDTHTDTAAIIGWDDTPDGPQAPVVVILTTGDREGLYTLNPNTDDRWHITTNPDDTWTPGDPT